MVQGTRPDAQASGPLLGLYCVAVLAVPVLCGSTSEHRTKQRAGLACALPRAALRVQHTRHHLTASVMADSHAAPGRGRRGLGLRARACKIPGSSCRAVGAGGAGGSIAGSRRGRRWGRGSSRASPGARLGVGASPAQPQPCQKPDYCSQGPGSSCAGNRHSPAAVQREDAGCRASREVCTGLPPRPATPRPPRSCRHSQPARGCQTRDALCDDS